MNPASLFTLVATAWLCLAATAASAEPIRLELPVRCKLDSECYVQTYVDRDPGPEAADYRCGSLVYDGHRGTDFRLGSLDLMDRGIPVVAAADGRVLVTRDGVRDAHMKLFGRKIAFHRGAGNMVQIDHGGGWKAMYAHLRRGSVQVRPGDRVKAGDQIGLVGMSGLTEFPHLHFELVRNGRSVDPFVGETDATGCRVEAHPLWSPPVRALLGYRRSLVINAGFSDVPLSREALLYEHHVQGSLPRQAPNLVFNVDFAGIRAGDSYRMRILGPDGSVFAESADRLTDDRFVDFRFLGRRLADKPGWAPGIYRGEFMLYREDSGRREIFAEHTETLKIE